MKTVERNSATFYLTWPPGPTQCLTSLEVERWGPRHRLLRRLVRFAAEPLIAMCRLQQSAASDSWRGSLLGDGFTRKPDESTNQAGVGQLLQPWIGLMKNPQIYNPRRSCSTTGQAEASSSSVREQKAIMTQNLDETVPLIVTMQVL